MLIKTWCLFYSIQAIYLTPISRHDVMMTAKNPSIPIPVYLISRICEFILMSTWLVSLNGDVNKATHKILECVCVCALAFPQMLGFLEKA